MHSTRRPLAAALISGTLAVAMIPAVGGPWASASVSQVTAKVAVAAATPYQSPASGASVTNLMNLIAVTGDDTFSVSGAQSVVSIRLDSSPLDDLGAPSSIQLSANTLAPTVGSGFGVTAAGTTTAISVTAPTDYLWPTGGVVQLTNLNPSARVLTLQGAAPRGGSYGFTAWVNDGTGSNTVLDPGEPFTTGTLIVGGDVASFALNPPARVMGTGQTGTFAVTAKDAQGRNTFPVGDDTTGPWGSLTVTPATGVTVEVGGVTTSDGTGKLTARSFINPSYSILQGVASVKVTPTSNGQYTLRVGPGGTLPGTVTVADATLAVVPSATLLSAISSGPTANSSNPVTYTPQSSVAASNSATGLVYVPVSESTTTFAMTATSSSTVGQLLPYTVVDGSSGTEAGVSEGTFSAAIDASKKATIEITASDAQAGDLYYVVLGQGSNKVGYTVTYGAPALSITNLTTIPAKGSTQFAQTNSPVPIAASVTDQYGQALSDITVTSVPSVSTASSGVTDSAGSTVVTIPSAGSIVSQTVDFKIQAPLGTATAPTGQPVTILYNASGSPASLTVSSGAGNVAASASAIQNVDVSGANTASWAANSSTGWMPVIATVGGGTSGVPVTFSAPDVYFSATPGAASLTATGVKDGRLTANTGGGGTVTVYAKATKTGTASLTVAAGGLRDSIAWNVANVPGDARVVSVSPTSQEAKGRAQVTATVTDAFGNLVASAPLTFAEEGVGNFVSGASTLAAFTGPSGSVTVDVLSAAFGISNVIVTATATADYAGLPDSPVAGSPAGVSVGVGSITFQGAKGIVISASRTTSAGKSAIRVDGETKGFATDDTVIPYVKFPGGTDYVQGAARPTISESGDFTWTRRTGKKIYIYFTSADGQVKSNTIVIRAA